MSILIVLNINFDFHHIIFIIDMNLFLLKVSYYLFLIDLFIFYSLIFGFGIILADDLLNVFS